jgi:glycosyltransferase involved in cell wall biosynthesis
MKKLLTIVTVCFNSEKTIRKCIESVIPQLTEEVEYLFIDGKSSDSTISIINEYSKYGVRVISEKDNGIYDAMNKGIRLAEGEWIWYINSDDVINCGLVDIIISAIKKFPNAGCIYGDMEYVRIINGKHYMEEKIAPDNLTGLKSEMVIGHPSAICKVDVLRVLNGFDTNFKIAADWDLLLRIYNSGYQMQHIRHTLSRFYCGGASSKNHNKERHLVRKKNNSYKVIDFHWIIDNMKEFILGSALGKIIERKQIAVSQEV